MVTSKSVFCSMYPKSSSSLVRISGGSSFVSYPKGITSLEDRKTLACSEVSRAGGPPSTRAPFSCLGDFGTRSGPASLEDCEGKGVEGEGVSVFPNERSGRPRPVAPNKVPWYFLKWAP